MISLRKFGMLGLSFGALLALAGCQTGGGGSMQMSGEPSAVTCTKCKTVWVQVPTTGQGKNPLHKYTSAQNMECPDCKSAVADFFTTGKLQHACKTCGETMEVCKDHAD